MEQRASSPWVWPNWLHLDEPILIICARSLSAAPEFTMVWTPPYSFYSISNETVVLVPGESRVLTVLSTQSHEWGRELHMARTSGIVIFL